MNVPHYRRNYKTGAENLDAMDLLNIVLIEGLQRLAKSGEFETLGELFKEMDFLLNENGLTTRNNEQTGEMEMTPSRRLVEVCQICGLPGLQQQEATACKQFQKDWKESQPTFYMLIDNHTDDIFRTKSGRIKEFKTPDAACDYMHETIDNLNMRIVDQDERPVPGW